MYSVHIFVQPNAEMYRNYINLCAVIL